MLLRPRDLPLYWRRKVRVVDEAGELVHRCIEVDMATSTAKVALAGKPFQTAEIRPVTVEAPGREREWMRFLLELEAAESGNIAVQSGRKRAYEIGAKWGIDLVGTARTTRRGQNRRRKR